MKNEEQLSHEQAQKSYTHKSKQKEEKKTTKIVNWIEPGRGLHCCV